MFLDRLKDNHFCTLARNLTSKHTEVNAQSWSIHINRQKNFVRLSLFVHYDKAYDVSLLLSDFRVDILNPGLLSTDFITKTFFMFMYQFLGEEYKTAYLANAAKIFEKE